MSDRKRLTKREKMCRALQRRHLKIADELRQLKRDVDFYNANNLDGAVIEIDFDLNKDVAKARAAEQSAKAADD